MSEPADGAPRYDLFTRDGEMRLVWRLADEGVALEPEALVLHRGGRWTQANYSDMLSVALTSGSFAGANTIGTCTIEMRSGLRIVVSNVNASGVSDGRRDGTYRRFVADFHQHLVAAGAAGTMRFQSGFGEGRITGLFLLGIVASALFVVLPLILLLATHELRTLWITVAGLGLIVPLWRTFSANQPATYDPGAPPDLLP
jgi:hypothetical protein